MIIHTLTELSFSKLMEVYLEGNLENGAASYPHLSSAEQLLSAEQDFYQYLKQVFFKQQNSFYSVWNERGKYCSALRVEPYLDGYLVCAVETAPELRNQGFATKLVEGVISYLSERSGGMLYSHVSKKNTPSLRLHEKCGFQTVMDHARYTDGSVLPNLYTLAVKLNRPKA